MNTTETVNTIINTTETVNTITNTTIGTTTTKYYTTYDWLPYHSHLLLLLSHVVIVVKLCCVEGLMVTSLVKNTRKQF